MSSASAEIDRALRVAAERLGLRFHQKFYRHPLMGDIPMNSFCFGACRGFAVFGGWVGSGGSHPVIRAVIEVTYSALPAGVAPVQMKSPPSSAPSSVASYETFFSGAGVSPTDAAKASLLALGVGANQVVVDTERLLLVPERVPKTPDEVVAWLDRCCAALESLGARRLPDELAQQVYTEASLDDVWHRYSKHGYRWSRSTVLGIAAVIVLFLVAMALRWLW